MELANDREQRGQIIARAGRTIKRINKFTYRVKSQTNGKYYHVKTTDIGWKCDCPDHKYRGVKCKHIFAVEISYAIRETVREDVVIQQITANLCPQCKSTKLVKHGIRHNKYGDIQRYCCKDCHKRFTINIGFEKMHTTPHIITEAMQLYFSGESFRNITNFFRVQSVNISHVAVYRWINKYTSLMESYLERLKPRVGNAWRTDELYVKISGNMKYLYALMDDETRYWIAQQVSATKFTADVRPLFRKAKEIAGKRPNILISDGAHNFNQAFKDEFFTRRNPRSRRVRHIRLQGDHNNNKMERLNSEVRDREKVMRGLKKINTSVLPGYQMYHNYFRPHEGIGNVTPAEKCGLIGSIFWIMKI
ncbi:MAG: DDE-type integrase/transposase/recombinase [Nitrososphaeraceae archaeon]